MIWVMWFERCVWDVEEWEALLANGNPPKVQP